MKNKKTLIIIAIALVIAIGAVIAIICLNAGSDKAEGDSKPVVSQENEKTDSEPQKKSESENEEPKVDATAPENTKYGDTEVYENDKGVPVAKTESGVEVELTGDNLQKLFAEYEKVKGSGSDEEKELLDQLQLILETQGSVQ